MIPKDLPGEGNIIVFDNGATPYKDLAHCGCSYVLEIDPSDNSLVWVYENSHFFFALYWAQALAAQKDDAALAAHFAPIAKALAENEQKITSEIAAVQGRPADLGGYYHTDAAKTEAAMRPSQTFTHIIG